MRPSLFLVVQGQRLELAVLCCLSRRGAWASFSSLMPCARALPHCLSRRCVLAAPVQAALGCSLAASFSLLSSSGAAGTQRLLSLPYPLPLVLRLLPSCSAPELCLTALVGAASSLRPYKQHWAVLWRLRFLCCLHRAQRGRSAY